MAVKSIFLLAIYCLMCCSISRSKKVLQPRTEKELFQSLLLRSDMLLKPPGNKQGTVQLQLDFEIVRIVDLDVDRQVLTLDARMHLKWRDTRLMWHPRPSNSTSVILPVSEIWTPDIVLFNNAGIGDGLVDTVSAIVTYDGSVFYMKPVRLSSYCPVPDTSQGRVNCQLKFGSWLYDGNKLDLVYPPGQTEVSVYQFDDMNRKWTLYRSSVQRNAIKYECCPEIYLDLTYTLTINRKTV